MTPRAGRTTHTFRRLSRALRAEGRPCWLCGQDIDYDADPGSYDSFTVDHILPLSMHPELAEVWSNLAAAHRGCNSSRGTKTPTAGLGLGPKQW